MVTTTVFDSLMSAETCWREFEREGTALAYQTYDYVKVWADTTSHGARMEPCPVAIHSDDGEPLLFFPIGCWRGVLYGKQRKMISWLAEDLGDQLAPIVTSAGAALDAEEVRKICKATTKAVPDADVFILHHQPGEIYGVRNPLVDLGLRSHAQTHWTRLEPDWTAYHHSKMKQKRRKESRRLLRLLGERGEVVFRVVTDPAEFAGVIDTLISQKQRRLEETGQPDFFDDDGYVKFYHELTARHPEMVRLSVLTVDEEIIAVDWGVVHNRTFHGLMTTNAGGDWAPMAPGRLLTEWAIQWSCEHDIDVFDFSIGDEGYKDKWCEGSTDLLRTELPISLSGHVSTTPSKLRRKVGSSSVLQTLRARSS